MRRAPYAYVALAVLSLMLSGAALVGAIGYYHASQSAQQRQGQLLEQRLCTTLGHLAALAPPPAEPGDLSRAYLARQHQALAELGPDVGCGRR